MARRKRKEEEADWVAPDFHEVGYMRRESPGAHAAFARSLWAVPMGSNNSIFILFRATDNSGLASLHVTVTPASQTGFELNWTPLSGKSQCARHRLEDYPAGAYNVTFPLNPPASSYTFAIVAT